MNGKSSNVPAPPPAPAAANILGDSAPFGEEVGSVT